MRALLCGSAGHDQREGRFLNWDQICFKYQTKNEAPTSLFSAPQEFYDEWPVKLGDVEPYKGPKTPDGRVIKQSFSSQTTL